MSYWVEYVVPGLNSNVSGPAQGKVVESATHPKATGDIEWVYGPYPTQAAAQEAINSGSALSGGAPGGSSVSAQGGLTSKGGGAGSGLSAFPGFNLIFGNTKGLLGRILKVGIGSVLIIVGVSKMMNVDNKITELAKKIPVIPV